MDYYEVGQRIRRIRRAKGYSQEQLAEITGISVTHMSHIETGNTKLSMEVFYNIVNALECSADELIFGIERNPVANIRSDIFFTLERCTKKELLIISDVIKGVKAALCKYN